MKTLSLITVLILIPLSVLGRQMSGVDFANGTAHIKITESAGELRSTNPDQLWDIIIPGSLFGNASSYTITPAFTTDPRFEERHRRHGLDRWYRVEFSEKSVDAFVNQSLRNPNIEIAEPVPIPVIFEEPVYEMVNHFLSGLQNGSDADTLYHRQWHYENTGQTNGTPESDINLPEAWEITTGNPEVIVQVMDSGIKTSHPDLENMLWVNPNPDNSNGYEGDIHGWNFAQDNNDIEDHLGHGTHSSGTIAAESFNVTGVAGVAGGDGSGNGIRLMIARAFASGANGGFHNAFIYAADNGAVISSNSWGYNTVGFFPEIVENAIDYFIQNAGYDEDGNVTGPVAGGVAIFAAGNNNTTNLFYPAAYPPVLSVTGTNHRDEKSWYSNYGPHVDVSAPGGELRGPGNREGVYSTDSESRGMYSFRQGTSMAAPHVAGIAALIASDNPGIKNRDLIHRIMETTDDIYDINPNFESSLGTGRVNAFRALTEDVTPAAPLILLPGEDASVDEVSDVLLAWEASTYAESYEVFVSEDAEFNQIVFSASGISGLSLEPNNLEKFRTYYWGVRGINQIGNGPKSTSRFAIAGIASTEHDVNRPSKAQLHPNYPNPFNPSTLIRYTLPEVSSVRLEIFNIQGQRVAELVNGSRHAGDHTAMFSAAGLASGVYIARLQVSGANLSAASPVVLSQRMLLIK